MSENNKFAYTYSAREQAEIKKIREKYSEPTKKEPSTLEKLRALDSGVTKKATCIALIIGIIGALILGTGMSLVMTDLANILGALKEFYLPIGIALGLIGIVLIAIAHPVYNRVIKQERKKIAPEIIRLSDELLK